MGDIPVPFGPPTPAVSEAIDTFLDICVKCDCAGRDIQVSALKIQQQIENHTCNAFRDFLPLQDLIKNNMLRGVWITGSAAEGLTLAVVGDLDTMFTWYSYPEVVFQVSKESASVYTNGYVIATQSNRNNPAFLSLEVPALVHLHPIFQNFITENQTHEGHRKFVSSVLFINFYQHPFNALQGTALTTVGTPSCISTDFVPCLVSPMWPKCALDFLSRHQIPQLAV